jgi:8-oxo-dGTP pyrophosphatase MutT (NUDIX family)
VGIGAFNIRVYGIAIKDGRLLISTEMGGDHAFTKFPGGGLEPGEGLADCLIREWKEEMGADVAVENLFYVNEFYQPSAFNPSQQIISFYYSVKLLSEEITFKSIEKRWNREYLVEFRWEPMSELQEDDFTFPIDRIVFKQLRENYLNK